MTRRPVPPSAELPESTRSELHALYREGAVSEPGALLDQHILAAARADLAAQSAKSSKLQQAPWWKAWLRPASAVAVAVLGLSLSWQLSDQQERDRRQEIGGAHEQPKAADNADQGTAAQPPRAAAPANKAQAPAVNGRAPASAELPARARAQAAPPAAAAEPRAFPAQEEAAKSKAGVASGSVARPAQAPLPALPATPAEKKNLRSDEGDARAKNDHSAAPATGTALPIDKREAGRRAEPAAAEAATLGKSAAEAATPQAWLQQIRELRAVGREAEAAQSLSRFRVRYPDFVLPEDLDALK